MQKIKMYLYIIIALFIMFPSVIYAATELGASTQNPVVGTDVYVQLDLNYGTKLNIGDVHLFINYDPSYLEFEEVIWIQSRGTYSSELGKITIDKEFGNSWKSGATLQIKFKVLRDGLTKVEVKRNGESHYDNGDVIGQSFVGVAISATKPSSQTLIGTLYVEGYTLQPTFSKTTYQYNLTVPSNVSNITIFATKSDSRQTLSGLGYQKLSYGDNNFPVIVTAQDGSSRTYNIKVHRTDDRNGDTSLLSLNVSDTNIKYDKDKDVYEATVSRSVESVLITARTNDPNATVIGTGRKSLNIGVNTFNLTVSSSGGRESNYTIKINRSTEEIQQVVKSSKLKTLKVNGLVMD
ncbi:MAG: cadherin-like beta sandwich domain-containing protein, partial [Bacilli bacterium]|nr:cadherin-like beta sandwich domain-containing protein [Bacilli bacterium]